MTAETAVRRGAGMTAPRRTFSLPEADWQWLDPGEAPPGSFKSLAFARNRAGVNFWLKTDTIAPGEGVGPESYDDLERALAESKPRRNSARRWSLTYLASTGATNTAGAKWVFA